MSWRGWLLVVASWALVARWVLMSDGGRLMVAGDSGLVRESDIDGRSKNRPFRDASTPAILSTREGENHNPTGRVAQPCQESVVD